MYLIERFESRKNNTKTMNIYLIGELSNPMDPKIGEDYQTIKHNKMNGIDRRDYIDPV